MAEKRTRGRWYWHCHACGQYVPREQKRCSSCGTPKQHKRRAATEAKVWPVRGAGGLVFGVGVILLWLVLLWMVLREHTPPPAPNRRGAVDDVPAVMTQLVLDSRAGTAHTSG